MVRLEAVASRFEDIEDTKGAGHSKRRSTSASIGIAETPSASVPPPPPPPPVIELPRAVAAYDEIVLEAKLKPFLEVNKAIAPPAVNAQVILPHVSFFSVLKPCGLLG
jgi:adenylyl cyclase-associated protein